MAEEVPTVEEARRVVNNVLNFFGDEAESSATTPKADSAKDTNMEDEKDPKAEIPAEEGGSDAQAPEGMEAATIEQIAEAAGVTPEQVQEFLEKQNLMESVDAVLMAVGQDSELMAQLVRLIQGAYGKESAYSDKAEVV